MSFLHKLWDETLAGPAPDSGLSRLRKYNSFSASRSPPMTLSNDDVVSNIVPRRIEIPQNSFPDSPTGGSSTPPPTPPAETAAGGEEFKRLTRRRSSVDYPRRRPNNLDGADRTSPSVYD